jgi:DnaJ like chaperone protein
MFMGKLIGAMIGLVFGPLGMVIGFLIGAFFDSRITVINNSFFSDNLFSSNVFFESLPLLAAEITRSGGTQKVAVLTTKNMFVDLFGKQNANIMMQRYREYVESGFSPFLLKEVCDGILYNSDHQTKIYIISTLFTILNAVGNYTPQEIFAIQNISRFIGVSSYEFESILNRFKEKGYSRHNFESASSSSSAYGVMDLDEKSSENDIKKRYRELSKKFHPDTTMNLPKDKRDEAGRKMREINNAYETIKKMKNIK